MNGIELRDALLADAVGPQREKGKDVNAQAASDYIVSVLQEMDRKQAKSAPPTSTKKPGAMEREYEKRSGNPAEGWRVDYEPPKIKSAQAARDAGYARLRKRLRWILSKPDLRAELKGLAPVLVGGRPEAREKAAEKVRALLAKSDRLYGREWWKPEPKRLWSR